MWARKNYSLMSRARLRQTAAERDELYKKFVKAIQEIQQKSGLKNLLLEKKLATLADSLEKKEAQLNEVLSASNLDPAAIQLVTRKLEARVHLHFLLLPPLRLLVFDSQFCVTTWCSECASNLCVVVVHT